MGNMNTVVSNFIGGALLFLVFAIVVALVLRELICWYWKINKNVELLTEIRDLLAKSVPQAGMAPLAPREQQALGSGGEPPTTAQTSA